MRLHFELSIVWLYLTAYFVSLIPEATPQCVGGTTDLTVETGKVLIYDHPNDGSANYATNLDFCLKVVPDPSGQDVLVRVRTTIGVGDFLTVSKGSMAGGAVVIQKTDKQSNSETQLVSPGNTFVRFTSDNNLDTVKDKSFGIDFVTGTGTGCTATVPPATATPQLLTSPNFPDKYQKSQTCTWTITTTDSSEKVQVKLIFMDVESEATCAFDSLQIIDSAGPGLVSKRCGTEWSPTFTYTSVSSTLDIKLVSDAFTPQHGFVIEYVQTTKTTTSTTVTATTATTEATTTTTSTANPAVGDSGGVDFLVLFNLFFVTFLSAQIIASLFIL